MKRLTITWPEVNNGYTFRDYIKSKHADLTLLQFYASMHTASGINTEWASRIANGQVAVNSATVYDTQHILRIGDVVSYTRLPWREPACPSHVDVLYEDDDMVALAKPSGLQVLPAAMFHQRTVLTLLQLHYHGDLQRPPAIAEAAAGPAAAAAGPAAAAAGPAAAAAGPAAAAAGPAAAATGPAAAAAGSTPAAAAATAVGGPASQSSVPAVAAATASGGGSGGGAAGSPPSHLQQQRDQRRRGQGPAAAAGSGSGKTLGVPAPVHRLGRGTSGLLLCARTPHARRRLTELLMCKTAAAAAEAAVTATDTATVGLGTGKCGLATVPPPPPASSHPPPPLLRKIYRALVEGIVGEDEGRVEAAIGPIAHPGVDGGLFAATPDGKPAISVWRVLERRAAAGQARGKRSGGEDGSSSGATAGVTAAVGAGSYSATSVERTSGGGQRQQRQPATQERRDVAQGQEAGVGDETLMQVEILTGRPHQIRIHMAAMGHPLVGDPLYGIGGRPKAGLDAAALLEDGELQPPPPPVVVGKGKGPQAGGSFGRPGDCGYHLHSLELHLPHPITGRPLQLRAPPPPLLMTVAEREPEREGENSYDF